MEKIIIFKIFILYLNLILLIILTKFTNSDMKTGKNSDLIPKLKLLRGKINKNQDNFSEKQK